LDSKASTRCSKRRTFIADPVQQDPAPDKKSDMRSVKERYQAYKRATRKDVEEEGRFEEFEE
jgi:hypothetical protein